MTESLMRTIVDFFGDTYFGIFIIAMLPIVELRLAVPFGVGMGFPLLPTLGVAVLGNILPVPLLILFSQQMLRWLAKIKKIGPFFQKIIDKAGEKAAKIGNKELLGLFLFVALPLPGTGAWTGSLIAAILQLNWKKALLFIALGVIAAGIIMTILSAGVFGSIFDFNIELH